MERVPDSQNGPKTQNSRVLMLSHQKTCYIQCTTYFTHLSKRTLLENWVLREKHTAGGESLGQSKHTWKPNLFSKTQLKVFALSMDFWSRFPKRKMKEMHCVPEWFHQGILKKKKPCNFLLTQELANDFDQVHIHMGCVHVTQGQRVTDPTGP